MPERYRSKAGKINAGADVLEPAIVRELEAEIEKLKKELEDSIETVEILKQVVRDYAEREKKKTDSL